MKTADPVETWAPMFTKAHSDEQIIALVCRDPQHRYCPLCDAHLESTDTPAAHRKRHRKELVGWRRQKAKRARKEARERAAKARAVKNAKSKEVN